MENKQNRSPADRTLEDAVGRQTALRVKSGLKGGRIALNHSEAVIRGVHAS